MRWIFPYWLITPLILLDSVRKYDFFKTCPINFGIWYIIFSLILLFLTLSYFGAVYSKSWVQNSTFVNFFDFYFSWFNFSAISLTIWSSIGAVIFVYILVRENKCFNYDEIFLFGIFFLIVLILISVTLCAFLTEIRKYYRERSLERARRKEYSSVYERIEKDPDFSTADYLRENRAFLEELQLVEHDVEILKKNFVSKFKIGFIRKFTKKKINDDEIDFSEPLCSICHSNFEDDEDVFRHPVCEHLYHWDCVEIWLVQKKNCPTCKRNTRVCLIDYFKSKRMF